MAINAIVEPYVDVTEVIHDYPTQLNISNTSTIAGVIVAPTGPRISYVNGYQDFLKKYTTNGSIPRNADVTFLNAYFLSFASGLVLVRSMNTQAVGGLLLKKSSTERWDVDIKSVDSNNNPILNDAKVTIRSNGSTNTFAFGTKPTAQDLSIVPEDTKLENDGNVTTGVIKLNALAFITPSSCEIYSIKYREGLTINSYDVTADQFSIRGVTNDLNGEDTCISFYCEKNGTRYSQRLYTYGYITGGRIRSYQYYYGDNLLSSSIRSDGEIIYTINSEILESGDELIFNNNECFIDHLLKPTATYDVDSKSILIGNIDTLDFNDKTITATVQAISNGIAYTKTLTFVDGECTNAASTPMVNNYYWCESISDMCLMSSGLTGTELTYNTESSSINVECGKAAVIESETQEIINFTQATSIDSFEAVKWIFKGEDPIRYKQEIRIKPNNLNRFIFSIGTTAFYYGTIDKTDFLDYELIQVPVKTVGSNVVPDLEIIPTTLNNLEGVIATAEDSGDYVITIGLITEDALESKVPDEYASIIEIDKSTSEYTIDGKSYMEDFDFSVTYSQPSNTDEVTLRLLKGTGDVFELNYKVKGTDETLTVSLNPDGVDANGNNCYIENYNIVQDTLTFIVNPDKEFESYPIPNITTTYKFGKSGFDLTASDSNACRINALNELSDYDKYPIEYFTEFGYTNTQFLTNYIAMGLKRDWFSPVSLPFTAKSVAAMRLFGNGITETSNTMILGPFDRNTALTGWLAYIAPTSLYYRRVMENKLNGREFAAVFDINGGTLGYTNPTKLLNASARTSLLNAKAPIDYVIYDEGSDIYYLNDNRTHQSKNNIVSNEDIRRSINKVKKDVWRLLGSFKGRRNTVKTRRDVISAIDLYMRDEIMSQEEKPEEYRIICDESNNTAEIINANKLKVTLQIRYAGAIKFIDVLLDAYPLGVDFED